MLKILITCEYCDKRFERFVWHVNQNKKNGNKNYCSRICQGKSYSKSRSGENNSHYGKIGCWAGKKRPDHSKEMIGKNNPMFGVHRYGKDAPGYGKIGKKLSLETRAKISKAQSGESNPNWKGGITPENVKERNCPKNKQFIREILQRDSFTCQACDQHGGRLCVDHIMPWALYPKLRYDSDNARTLCKPCHIKYGTVPHANPIKWATSSIIKAERIKINEF